MKSVFSKPEVVSCRTVHPFPARMAASIPWEILRSQSRRLHVLDPMVGSGTSLIVARSRGHVATGFDLDPLAVLIARVGCANLQRGQLVESAERTLRSAGRMSIATPRAYPINADEETREFADYWFDLRARKQLAALSRAIRDTRNSAARKFLWCALSRLVITKDAGVSLARDVSHSRPHKFFSRAPVEPFNAFKAAIERVAAACIFEASQKLPSAHIRHGDARNLPIDSESVDLVITSPPYLNAIDYMRGHKLSLVWMGYNISQLRRIRSNSVGTESSSPHGDNDAFVSQIVHSMGDVRRLPARFQKMISRYVVDMDGVISEIARVLACGSQAVLVLGDCTLRGVYIKNSIAIQLLAEAYHLKLLSERRRRIPDVRRYLPPPGRKSGERLAKRMRTEVVLSYRK